MLSKILKFSNFFFDKKLEYRVLIDVFMIDIVIRK